VIGFRSDTKRTTARFEAAHEFGHLLMHADVAAGSSHREYDADCFARAFLLPAQTFGSEAPSGPDLATYRVLERRWGVPLPMLIARAFELGCLGESSYRRLVWLNKEGSRREPAQPSEIVTQVGERPVLLRHALSLLSTDWPLHRIAARLSVSSTDLQTLTGAPAEPSEAFAHERISPAAKPG
jgi:Zn-dependent peptidase ImmA (M78 family)